MNYYGREWLTDLGSMEIYFTSCGSASVTTNHDPWCWWFLQFPTAPSKWHFWPFALPSAQSCVNKRCGCGCPVLFVNLGTSHHYYNPTSPKKGSIDRYAKYACTGRRIVCKHECQFFLSMSHCLSESWCDYWDFPQFAVTIDCLPLPITLVSGLVTGSLGKNIVTATLQCTVQLQTKVRKDLTITE